MPTSERSKKLRALGNLDDEDRYLLGNARCLSEGVDVPALDGVAFVDPRRSEIDIIQAVGRAIRLSDGKETGTIIIPVFISDSDDPDEVLSTSEFDQVWKVVNALRSHDESLGEMLDQFRVGLGRKQKISFENTKIVFDVPKRISNEFVEAFETKLVETTTASWEFWYGLLSVYKEANGDCSVPRNLKADGFNLGIWVRTQRKAKTSMTEEKIEMLNSIGFVWDALEEVWIKGFALLSAYKEANGDCVVSQSYKVDGFNLGRWVGVQRLNKTSLTKERLDKLNSLGFVWATK
jgi:superfamily II DNA or RNA helicase